MRSAADDDFVAQSTALAAAQRQLDQRGVAVAARDQVGQVKLDDVIAGHTDRVDKMKPGIVTGRRKIGHSRQTRS